MRFGESEFRCDIKEVTHLVGGGKVTEAAFELGQSCAGYLVGVDGGARQILRRGLIPDLVVGDMDSLSRAEQESIPSERLVRLAEQETTDLDKAVRVVNAPLFLATGFCGARLDHSLAALSVLAKYPHKAIILLDETDIAFHLPREITLDLPIETRLSLFPLLPSNVHVEGLRWPGTDGELALHPVDRIGTSNEIASRPARLSEATSGIITVLPISTLDLVIRALSEARFHSL